MKAKLIGRAVAREDRTRVRILEGHGPRESALLLASRELVDVVRDRLDRSVQRLALQCSSLGGSEAQKLRLWGPDTFGVIGVLRGAVGPCESDVKSRPTLGGVPAKRRAHPVAGFIDLLVRCDRHVRPSDRAPRMSTVPVGSDLGAI